MPYVGRANLAKGWSDPGRACRRMARAEPGGGDGRPRGTAAHASRSGPDELTDPARSPARPRRGFLSADGGAIRPRSVLGPAALVQEPRRRSRNSTRISAPDDATSRPGNSSGRTLTSRPPSGSSPGWPRGSSTPIAGAAAPRPEAVEHPDRRRRHADAAGLQPRGRRTGSTRPRTGRRRDARRHLAVHGARAPRRLRPEGDDAGRGRRRAVRPVRPRA